VKFQKYVSGGDTLGTSKSPKAVVKEHEGVVWLEEDEIIKQETFREEAESNRVPLRTSSHDTQRDEVRLVPCYKVLNEADYLEPSLRSIYPHAHRIVIVEGCTNHFKRVAPEMVTEDGLSIDGTSEIIKNFPDPEGKIVYIQAGFFGETLNQLGHYWFPYIDDGDIFFHIDGDEVWYDWSLRRIKEIFLYRRPKTTVMTVMAYQFWHDLQHVILEDTMGLWHGDITIFREMKHPLCENSNPSNVRIQCTNPGGGGVGMRIPCYCHMAYARPDWRIYAKLKYLVSVGWDRCLVTNCIKNIRELDGKKYTEQEWVNHQVFFKNNWDWVNGVTCKNIDNIKIAPFYEKEIFNYPETLIFPYLHPYFHALCWDGKPLNMKDVESHYQEQMEKFKSGEYSYKKFSIF